MARNLKSGILITGDASGAVKATKLTREEMQKLSSATRKANETAAEQSRVLKDLAGFAATGAKALAGLGAAGAAAMAAIFQSTRGPIDELGKLSRRLGVTTQELAGLQLAAEFNGASAATLGTALEKMQKRLGEAADGTGQARDALEKLGLTTDELLKLNAAEQFKVISDRIRGLDTQAAKAAATADIFSNQGLKLLNTLEQGSGALNAITQEAIDYGLALDAVDVSKVEAANDAILRAESAIQGAKNQITVGLAPVVEELANQFATMAREGNGFADEIQSGFRGITAFAGVFADAMRGIEVLFKAVEVTALGFTSAFAGQIKLLLEAVSSVGNVIIENLVKPFQFVLEVSAKFSDTAAEALETVNNFADNFELRAPEAVDDFFNAQVDGLRGAIDELNALLLLELPSEQLKARLEVILKAAEDRAEKLTQEVKTKQENNARTFVAKNTFDPIAAQVEEVQRGQDIIAEGFDKKIADAGTSAADEISAAFSQLFATMDISLDGLTSGLGQIGASFASIGFDKAFGGAGGALGSFAGPIGSLAGNVVGQSIGTLFDDNASRSRKRNNFGLLTGGLGFLAPTSLFGGDPSDRAQFSILDFASGGINAGGQSGKKFSQENRDAADFAGKVLQSLNDALQGKTGRSISGTLGLQVGSRDGVRVVDDALDNGGNILGNFNNLADALEFAQERIFESFGVQTDIYERLSDEGETLTDTLIRVDDQMAAVNFVAKELGIGFEQMGNAGLLASDSLIEAVGGIEEFISQSQFFVKNFLDESEQFELLSNNLTNALSGFNFVLPDTREEFNQFYTDVADGNQELFAVLGDLLPELDNYYDHLEDEAEVKRQLANETERLNQRSADLLQTWIQSTAAAKLRAETQRALEFGAIKNPTPVNPFFSFGSLAGQIARDAINTPAPQAVDLTALQIRLAQTTGDSDTVTRLRRQQELSNASPEEQAILNLIFGAEDLIDRKEQLLRDQETAERDLINTRQDAIDTVNREIDSLSSTQAQFKNLGDSLRSFSFGLDTGSLSALSPEAQLDAARANFNSIARRAQIGDVDAIGQLQGAASSFLSESREFNGSGGSFADDFNRVQHVINSTADLADRQATNAERQLSELQKVAGETAKTNERLQNVEEAIQILTSMTQASGKASKDELEEVNEQLSALVSNSNLQIAGA